MKAGWALVARTTLPTAACLSSVRVGMVEVVTVVEGVVVVAVGVVVVVVEVAAAAAPMPVPPATLALLIRLAEATSSASAARTMTTVLLAVPPLALSPLSTPPTHPRLICPLRASP